MSELLSPAGTIEAFHAAIANGCDAIYLGLDKYSARAYANNFTLDSLKELLDFAHLRNVKIYVTINTIVYDKELDDVFLTIDKLAQMGVDAIIVQDLAVANYITSHYKSLKAHASTQMGIDDLDAASLAKDLGFARIVFARETELSKMKTIKSTLGIEVEAFIHGALCVSYSGNCYMSSSIGERSGNRGRCAGCCRKYYKLVNLESKEEIREGYLLSMKDLNTSNHIKDMSFVDSFKIEGRMKEPQYVASVTKTYREIIDNIPVNLSDLNKVFNRTYTEGFMNGKDSSDITNIEKPNNYGYLIGTVIKQNKQTIWIRLNSKLSKGDQIRIETKDNKQEISVPVLQLFDANFNKILSTNKVGVLTCEEKVEIGAKVYKTKDNEFVTEINKSLFNNEYKKLPLKMEFTAKANKPLFLKISYQKFNIFVKSKENAEVALTSSTSKENVIKQLEKLHDTPYFLKDIVVNLEENLFISIKSINELRREGIQKLNEERLSREVIFNANEEISVQQHDEQEKEITVEVYNDEQYEAASKLGIKHIYYKNKVARNNACYKSIEGEVLVNGLGGINHYKKTNVVVSDSSLNVVNHISVGILSSLGVNRITLSNEISKDDVISLIAKYKEKYHTNPNLELIVYGRNKIMHSKYCPLKRLNMCGQCKKHHFALRDDYADFSIIFNEDCTTTLLYSKPLNIMDDVIDIQGINYFRMVFTTETKEEVETLITNFKNKLEGKENKSLYVRTNNTKGHFINNPLL